MIFNYSIALDLYISSVKLSINFSAREDIYLRTEARIQKAFLRMLEGRTSFVIVHRLSTVKEANLILVMDNVNIVQNGTHEELLEKGGQYADLYNSQFANI